MKKRVLAVAVVFCMALGMTACGEKDAKQPSTEISFDTLDQLAMPEQGEEIVVMEVGGFGTVKIRMFPEAAPKAVENFVTHAKEGYYDGVTFHRVINDFMIQGGDPTGTGAGGESIWEKPFEDECNEVLMPIRGSLCMANAGEDTNGSQFFIVQTSDTNVTGYQLTQEQKALFEQYGGTPWLVGHHTVFGQVIEGMDVVDAIAAVETSSDKPVEDVVITKMTVETYR